MTVSIDGVKTKVVLKVWENDTTLGSNAIEKFTFINATININDIQS